MKREACITAAEGGQAAGRRSGGKRPPPKKQPPIGKFHKLGLSVRGFVEAAVGPGGGGDDDGSGSYGSFQKPAWNGRKNRREMKREKRKLKRGRRKRLLIVNGEAKRSLPSKTPSVTVKTPPPSVEEERKENEKKEKKKLPAKDQPPAKQPRSGPSATAATRKRALLAANEAEEREIRRLERQLGLHKRRKKQRREGDQEGEAAETASLPQSFARDGLDYVLGALKSEAAFSGLYENSDEGEGEGSGTEVEGLSPGEEDEDEVGSSEDSSLEEGSESEEVESSQEAARLAGGFWQLKSADLNIAMPEKQNCQAPRPEVK